MKQNSFQHHYSANFSFPDPFHPSYCLLLTSFVVERVWLLVLTLFRAAKCVHYSRCFHFLSPFVWLNFLCVEKPTFTFKFCTRQIWHCPILCQSGAVSASSWAVQNCICLLNLRFGSAPQFGCLMWVRVPQSAFTRSDSVCWYLKIGRQNRPFANQVHH